MLSRHPDRTRGREKKKRRARGPPGEAASSLPRMLSVELREAKAHVPSAETERPDLPAATTEIEEKSTRTRVGRRFDLLPALLFAAAQAGCGHESPSTPTSPAPTPTVVVTGANITMKIIPAHRGSDYPTAGELLLDGQAIWSGKIGALVYSPFQNCNSLEACRTNLVARVDYSLAAGAHRLTLRVTDQRQSPTAYSIYGEIGLDWSSAADEVLFIGSGSPVSLRTGQGWEISFAVPGQPSGSQ